MGTFTQLDQLMARLSRSVPSAISASSTALPLIFSHWLEAVTAFSESYHQLNQYVASKSDRELSSHFIAQCSTSQMDELRTKMYQQVQALVDELDTQLDGYRLINHTARLRALTNQAAVILNLRNQSSC